MTLCPSPTIASFTSDYPPRVDGPLDRKIVVTRSCGHTYFWSGKSINDTPTIGAPALGCLGDQVGTERSGTVPVEGQPGPIKTRGGKWKKMPTRREP